MKHALKGLIRREGKSPVVWMALISAAFAWPITAEYSPLSGSLGSSNAKDVAYDIAFVLAVTGAIYSSHRLSSQSWLLGRASVSVRMAIEMAWVSLGALLPALVSLMPLTALVGSAALPGVGTMALIATHMAAVMLFLKGVGLSQSERSLALILLALALPTALSGETGVLSLLGRILSPAAGVQPGSAGLHLTAHHLGSIVILTLISQALNPGSAHQK